VSISDEEKITNNLLAEIEPIIERADELNALQTIDLYKSLNEAAKFVASRTRIFVDQELRVKLCSYRDEVLDRVIDAEYDNYNNKPLPPPPAIIYAPSVQDWRTWSNTELLKECAMLPYFLAKRLNSKAVLPFGKQGQAYPYLNNLPGLELPLVENIDVDLFLKHLLENLEDIGVLILRGAYAETIRYLDIYRRLLRRDGKVYIGLDMNSNWAGRYPWKNSDVIRFFNQCDIIATSCRNMRDIINRNPECAFDCCWIPNGFSNVFDMPIIANPKKKENIILTVGRIGTQLKNNEELLVAFAKIAGRLPDWKIHLAGPVDNQIKPFISDYFAAFTDLKDRVIFLGNIVDKADLYSEYSKSKIFALTSVLEGGTPNVYAEALFHGCAFITSNIDAADDIINFGNLGLKYPLGNIDALAENMLTLCSAADEEFMTCHISSALKYANRYFDNERIARKLVFMLYNK
jgi:glycosyltransferase involved in cell wall biosynthesis